MPSDADIAIDFIGAFGGFIIALSLVPQIYKSHITMKTQDLSYSWQFIYIIGLAGYLIYGFYFQYWPVWVPALFEEALLVYLTLLKYYAENIYVAPDQKSISEDSSDDASKLDEEAILENFDPAT